MDSVNYFQILIFFIQAFLVSVLLLFLFRLRSILGLGLVFTVVGLFQFIQVFLSSTVYVEVAENIIVSPGSSILFPLSLFAILIIYIKEDALETRKVIYAVLTANIVTSLLLYTFGWNVENSHLYNPYNVSLELFNVNAWIIFVGTVVLFADSILIILVFEFISRFLKSLFLRICITMIIIMSFDTLIFSFGSFLGSDKFYSIIISGLISKNIIAIFYSLIFTFYIKYFDKNIYKVDPSSFKDFFNALTYRQKFEIATIEKEIVKKNAAEAIQLSEIKYSTLTDNSPVGVFKTLPNGKTTYVNNRWSEISGVSCSQALNDDWLNAVHPDDVTRLIENWNMDVLHESVSNSEYRFLHSDGSVKWVLGQAVPELNSDNKVIGYVGTITDITELKLYEIKLNKAKEKAEENTRLKSAFLANISHEIRTPMNGILGFAGLLKKPSLSGKNKIRYIQIIEKSGKRMLNIINDIVNISKIESGQMTLQITTLNINNMFDDLFAFFKQESDEKGLDLELVGQLEDECSECEVDAEKVFAILTNLIKNAIKYSDTGHIEFGCEKKANVYEFYVKDEGIGIPKERQDAIFDRFVQADIADKQAREGAGLGLSISKAYVEMMGGKIWMESNEGVGSCFHFQIPISID